MNPFPKKLVVMACEELIKEIEEARQQERLKVTTGKKRFVWFGRILTADESFAKLSNLEKMKIKVLHGSQKGQAMKILAVATNCQGDSINLSAKEFDVIKEWYGQ